MSKFYITTAIPYVNAKPHVGHALEFIQCDCIARYHRQRGDDTLLLSGSDENAVKNVQAAEAQGKEIQEFIDENAKYFVELAKALDVQIDVYQKGSDTEKHFKSSQELWKRCDENGDIYTKEYQGLYCVGCEAFYSESELNENKECFNHPGKPLEVVSETNYFFALSKYQTQLIDLIQSDELKIVPETRKNEVISFLKEPLQDISISRSNERAHNWGVPVPGDDSQRIYVWFDGLNIYQSGVGFGWDDTMYEKWWPADLHVIGKDISRFHAVYWPAFLMSAGLRLPKSLYIHGFITSEGQKMSKTLGNVIDPFEFIEKYGVSAVRYYLLREIPSGKDGDISTRRFIDLYNADLAHGLGNLVARTAKLAEGLTFELGAGEKSKVTFDPAYISFMDSYEFSLALEWVWKLIEEADKHLNTHEPWKIKDDDVKKTDILEPVVTAIRKIAWHIAPFLPQIAEKIQQQYEGSSISTGEVLFKRIDA